MDLSARLPASGAAEGHASLKRVLGSPLFCKAPRLSRLLRFLVEKKLNDALHDITEYGIGIGVFDRDPRSYSTGEDPIVRVQVGRLRGKLQLYYAECGRQDDVVISIPIGNYVPVIRRAAAGHAQPASIKVLVIHPFKDLSDAVAIATFVLGLGEELSCHLFHELGGAIVVHDLAAQEGHRIGRAPGSGLSPVASHLLEGSLRADGQLIRTSVRLIEAGSGAIVWSAQLDRHGAPGIAMQEDLAHAICMALKGHVIARGASPLSLPAPCHPTLDFERAGNA